MRKIFPIVSFIFMAFTAVSCNKADAGMISEFTPYVEDYSVKSVLSDAGQYVFQTGDRMLVTDGSNVSEFVYDEKTQKFKTDSPIPKSNSMQAIYPASIAKFENGKMVVNLPSSINVSQGQVADFPLYLWKIRDDVFKFKSFCGVAKIQLGGSGTALYDASLTKMVFSSAGNPCCGKATVAPDGTLDFISPSQQLEASCESGMTVRSAIYLALPAHKYPMGSKVSFQFSDGKEVVSETIMGIVPRSGMIKTYEIEITSNFFGPLEDYETGGSLDKHY